MNMTDRPTRRGLESHACDWQTKEKKTKATFEQVFVHDSDVRARQQRQLTQHGPFRAAENVRNTRLQAAKEEESQMQLRKQEARAKAQQRNNAQATKNETVDAATLRLKRLQFLGL